METRTSDAAAWRTTAACLGAALLLAGCGGDGGDPPVPAVAELQQACPRLAGTTVGPGAIGLPSGTATVASATLVAASADLPEYCEVKGSIAARTAGADAIRFQLNLPTTWNGKALMYGGGGFNGTLINATAALRDAPAGMPRPLTQGYATFGTDSGHDAAAYNDTDPGRFALNDEMFANFAHASYKKVKDVAHRLIDGFYLRTPSQQYFFGGSEGGREGLMLAQRYPADFDGIVSVVPVIHWTGLFNGFINWTKPQFNGGALNTAEIRTVAQAVTGACDALDGLADGVVNNYLACPARFNLQSLRCTAGADTGDDCLSDPQLATLAAAYGPTTLPFALANGLTTYPGRLFGGEIQPGSEGIGRWVTNGRVPGVPTPLADDGRGVIYGSSYARYVIARDAGFDVRTFDPANFQARIQEVSALMDSTNPDLSAFMRRGGKLIVRENTGDMAQSPMAGFQYYDSVVAKMGAADVDRFMRLYVSPASNHGGAAASLTTGETVPTTADLLSELDRWVTTGTAPADALVQVRNAAAPPHATLASRPMCRYPSYPQYVAGDATAAASYRCTVSAP
ncbi:tannase/feruloyl esterase family alpha/beta hydrolase [Aquincola sp. MAHUQ-54]|uniref:Tannase/feruloyl esterase family alpha/beta hydrolase n=1 Tax=Aquincola agrisoli TaxID=3119538 RepID=A0AAW9QEQ3_9BURK